MTGELQSDQIEEVLAENVVGRIGAHAFARTYVVPITYVYVQPFVYSHSGEGMKLHMMRESPRVCFEVDCMDPIGNWRSVIAWGTFEELKGKPAEEALALLINRLDALAAFPPGESAHPHAGMRTRVVYRICLEEKTGRYERRL